MNEAMKTSGGGAGRGPGMTIAIGVVVVIVALLFGNWDRVRGWFGAPDATRTASAPADKASPAPTATPGPQATAPSAPAGGSPGASTPAAPSSAVPPPSAPSSSASTPSSATPPAPSAATPPAAAPATPAAPSTEPPAVAAAPSFDVVRVGPDGRAVLAGKGTPGATVALKAGDADLATAEVDARGEWVILLNDKPLPPGSHELRIEQRQPGRPTVSGDRTMAVMVPQPPTAAPATPAPSAGAGPGAGASAAAAPPAAVPLVVATPVAPSAPSTVLQAATPQGLARSGDLVLGAVDYDELGMIVLSGKASAGAPVLLYLDNRPVAGATADAAGAWEMKPREPVPAGRYTLRLDRLGEGGKVVSRIEVPFERLSRSGGKLTVVRGDNLWNIARAHYGPTSGQRYVAIYEANQAAIKDPDLIYPGQIFTIPK